MSDLHNFSINCSPKTSQPSLFPKTIFYLFFGSKKGRHFYVTLPGVWWWTHISLPKITYWKNTWQSGAYLWRNDRKQEIHCLLWSSDSILRSTDVHTSWCNSDDVDHCST